MNANQREQDLRRLESLRAQVEQLEAELAQPQPANDWRRGDNYLTYYATTGFFLGMFGAMASLLFNVVGSLAVNQDPLKIVKIYLTFGLGSKAIEPGFDDQMAVAMGCCLYIATGMALGVPFQVLLSRYAKDSSLFTRLIWASGLGLLLWVVMYYGILSWLQPILFGDSYIVKLVPPHIGALTHLVFGWTMAVVFPWGLYEPYRARSANS